MGNFCACIITTSPQIMPPKRVLPTHTNSITQPLHTVHTGHVSVTSSLSICCARRVDVAPRAAPRAPRGQHPLGRLTNFPVVLHITIRVCLLGHASPRGRRDSVVLSTLWKNIAHKPVAPRTLNLPIHQLALSPPSQRLRRCGGRHDT